MLAFQTIRGSKALAYTSATVDVAMDGNSLVAGYRNPGFGNTVAQQLVSQPSSPLFGSGITVRNFGVSSQTWQDMLNTLPTFVSGKINILIPWEGINTITVTPATGAQAITHVQNYINAVRSVNAEVRIVLMTSTPKQTIRDWPSVEALNAEIDAYNELLRKKYLTMGAVALCDIRRPGGVFDMGGDYSDASFAACDTRAGATVWAEGTNGRIHLSDAGDAVVAGMLADTLRHVR